MQENIFLLKIKRKIAIVLDASDSAERYWERIIDCCNNFINNIPGDVEKEIYFLGNSKIYPEKELANANEWRSENKNRGSFITPILEKNKDVEKVIVIGSGRIFDLCDYADTDFADKIILVSVGESLKENENIGKEISPSDINNLYDPIKEVIIRGKSFMPYYWDNEGYKFELSAEGAILRGVNLNVFSVLIHGFGYDIETLCKTNNGEEMKFNIEKGKDTNIEEKWQNLSDEDEILFKNIVKDKKYICPICKKEHDYKKVKCKDKNRIIFDVCIYKSLINVNGFVIFKEQGSNILYKHHPLNVLKLGDEEVAIALNRFEIYKYKFEDQKWVRKNEFENYYKTNDGKWIIYL